MLPVLSDGPVVHGRGKKFILHTACRLDEALQARVRDINWREGLWTIPKTKSGVEHVIPLSWQAIALLHHRLPAEADADALIFATESVLGHVTLHTGLGSIYNRSRYRPQMAIALQQLADLLDELEYGEAAVPLSLAA